MICGDRKQGKTYRNGPGGIHLAPVSAVRVVVCFVICVLLSGPLEAEGPDLSSLASTLNRIVTKARGEVGVGLVHVETGARLSVNGDRRFPMASVYKLPIAVELLAQVARGKLRLDQPVFIAASDIRACCTLSRRHPLGGVTLTAGDLLELMIVESDNTAADAVLKLVGGPPMVQRRLRSLGFPAISVDRYEGDINFEMTGVENPPPQEQWTLELQRRLIFEVNARDLSEARARYVKDPRDSATPDDMARFLAALHAGALLPRSFTTMLLDLMLRCTTGPARIKGLLPPDTPVAHKTGTTNVVINDAGIITLPDDSAIPGHVALAVFATNGRVNAMQQMIAKVSGATYEFFTGRPLPPRPKAKAPARRHRSNLGVRRRVERPQQEAESVR
jgi:beta-lactamase class A